jgi:hypothetical protein
MMRLAISAIALLWSGAAEANWQYTKWGMSPAEVKGSTKAAVKDIDMPALNGPGFVSKLAVSYSALGVEFVAVFQFDLADKLTTVSLQPLNATCTDLRIKLIQVYGEPIYSKRSLYSLDQWRDDAGGNLVDLLAIGKDCYLKYRPTIAKGSGL